MSTEEDDRPRRGRPRPQDSIDRDRKILELLTEQGPQTRNDVSDSLRISRSLAYLALARLRGKGQIKCCLRDGVVVWSTEVENPCP